MSIAKKTIYMSLAQHLVGTIQMSLTPLDTPTLNYKLLRYYDISLPILFIVTLNTGHLQIEPTTIEHIPPSDFNNSVKGAEATHSLKITRHLPPSHNSTIRVITHKRYLATTKPFTHDNMIQMFYHLGFSLLLNE